jgi:hypothetical protein
MVKIITTLAILWCNLAYAGLIKGNGFTTDITTGLDWLDLTARQGVNFRTVLDGYGGYTTSGWHVATPDELYTFGVDAIGTPEPIRVLDNSWLPDGDPKPRRA